MNCYPSLRKGKSPWPGPAQNETKEQSQGNTSFPSRPAQRLVVRRLQRRVHARRSALLLSAHHHRLRQPLSVRLRPLEGLTDRSRRPTYPDRDADRTPEAGQAELGGAEDQREAN